MKETKTFFLNGEEYFSDKIINLSEIISYFNYNSSLLVLEYGLPTKKSPGRPPAHAPRDPGESW